MANRLYARIALVALTIVGAIGIGFISAPSTYALDCSGITTSIIGGSDICTGDVNPIWDILAFAIRILAGLVGLVAVGMIVYSGILYTSAQGNVNQVQKAKTQISNTVIGVVLFAGMAAILNYAIPGGVFGNGTNTNSNLSWDSSNVQSENGSGSDKSTKTEDTPSIANSCYWTSDQPPNGELYHRSGNTPYAFENSYSGIKYAKNHGYVRIDLDIRMTKDGVMIAAHSPKLLAKPDWWGGFHDTAGKITDRSTQVEDLTYAQIKRMKHADGYSIYSLEDMIKYAHDVGMKSLSLEIKTPKTLKKRLPQIATMLNKYKVEVYIAGQNAHAGNEAMLAYARKLGFWTRNITSQKTLSPNKDESLCKSFES